MFSDILSEKLKWRMAGSQYDEADLMSYEPEYSWNYELGGHFSCMDGAVRGDFAVFTLMSATNSSRSSRRDRARAG